jgi:hypothetical protein
MASRRIIIALVLGGILLLLFGLFYLMMLMQPHVLPLT